MELQYSTAQHSTAHLLLSGEVGAGDDQKVLHDGQKHPEAVVLHDGGADGRVQLLRVREVDGLLIAVRVLDLKQDVEGGSRRGNRKRRVE